VLKDIERRIYVTLHYTMEPHSGILARSATIENREAQPVTVEQAAAAAWALPPSHYTLNYLTGRWAGEWTLTQEAVKTGARVIESRRGSTGHQANPWFAIQAGESNEDQGDVWFGALAWSGSWRITVEQDQLDAVRVTGGFNPFDFGYVLHPGEKLETPVFYGGYAANGLGGASRKLHRFEIDHILPHRQDQKNAPKPRPVIYNSWEATEFRVDEAGQMALAEKAAALGVDRFVMDDGWFGQRKDEAAGTGPGAAVRIEPHRGEGAGGHSASGQRSLVDESWPGYGRWIPRRFSRRGFPAGPQIGLTVTGVFHAEDAGYPGPTGSLTA
jgi:alpha-galactosidase